MEKESQSTRGILSTSPENLNTFKDPINELITIDEYFKYTIRKIVQYELRKILKKDMNKIPKFGQLAETDVNLESMIPDIAKCLREFSNQTTEYVSWRRSVERILNIYDVTKGTPKYYGILNTIRKKIVGKADKTLKAHNTPMNWEKIVSCLNLHYEDKRDINTLDNQIYYIYKYLAR